ncbi:sigma-54 interaction domain-containing protein [Chitinolyticbacter meiyuanensis]|uniref:sigma-54 interaction domain-containing protein n=1 Tax=Chitinolyticbacter meiyuanensis TaxID=682798 RepID=UPI001FE5E657|nr:sigma-54 dependent transcriptional regulator [Chitinolyticbacter meiyuanensis]
MFETIRHESAHPSMPTLYSFSRGEARAEPAAKPIPQRDSDASRFGRLYGSSAPMQEVFRLVERVAPSDMSVLIIGESGCGKELIAQTVHEMSARADAPFIAVNCGALPATLVEAELFGYEKGAFTGASRTHQGFFERAQGGTLFLDEITEMPIELQVRLLRVLETGVLTRVGGDREIACNARILAATNREPLEAVRSGHLREDLMYRLAVFPVVLPPLRERADDVMLLAQHFLDDLNSQYSTDKQFAADVAERLASHAWPGNVRELKNCIQRAYILSDEAVEIDTLAPLKRCDAVVNGNCMQFEIGTPLEEVEQQLIFATLARFQGNKRRAAEALGVSLKTIYNRLNSYSSDKARQLAQQFGTSINDDDNVINAANYA